MWRKPDLLLKPVSGSEMDAGQRSCRLGGAGAVAVVRGGGDGGDGAGTAKVVGVREKKESEVSVVVKKNEQSEVWVEVK